MADEFAYAPNGTLVLRTKDMRLLSKTVSAEEGVPYADVLPQNWVKYPSDYLENLNVYPVKRVTSPDPVLAYQVKQSESDDGIQPDKTWLVTETWVDRPVDDVKAEIRQAVSNIAVNGQINRVGASEPLRVISKALRVLEEGLLLLAERELGADHGTWPQVAKNWDAKRLEVRSDFQTLLKAEEVRDAEVSKYAEVDALADMDAVRAYDETADWPAGTIS